MKKFLLTAAMGAMFFIGLTSMTKMDPPANKDCNEFCAFLETLPFLNLPNHGACMSLCAACSNPGQGEGKFAVCLCNIFDVQYGLENLGVNFGQCVTLVKGGG